MGHTCIIVFCTIYLFVLNEIFYGVETRQIPFPIYEERTTMQPTDIITINGKEFTIINFLPLLEQIPNPPDILTDGNVYTIQKYLSESLTSNIQLISNGQILNLSDISRLLGGASIFCRTPMTFNIFGGKYTLKDLIKTFAKKLSGSISVNFNNGMEEIYYNGMLITPQDLINLISGKSGINQNVYPKNEKGYKKLEIENFYKILRQLQYNPDIMLQIENQYFTIKDFLYTYPNGFTGNIRIYLGKTEIDYDDLLKMVPHETNPSIFNNIRDSLSKLNRHWQFEYTFGNKSPRTRKDDINFDPQQNKNEPKTRKYFDIIKKSLPRSNFRHGKLSQKEIPINDFGNRPQTVLVTEEFVTGLIYKGHTYTPGDILRLLSAENSSDIIILHNSKEYSPAEYLKEFGNLIPCDFSIYKDKVFIDLKDIPNILDLDNSNIHSHTDARKTIMNKYESREFSNSDSIRNLLDILKSNSKDNIRILYLNKVYGIDDFLKIFNQHLPRHFQTIINEMVIDLEDTPKYLDLNTGSLLENDTDSNFPSIYHNGIVYSPLDILIQIRKSPENNIQVLHENEYYSPEAYLKRFNIDFVPKNFQLVHDGQIIKPSDITRLIKLERIFPELYYRGIRLRPADVIRNLAMQKFTPVDVSYQNQVFSPKEFATMFDQIPDDFDIISGNIILEPEFVVRNLIQLPGTKRYDNPELVQLLEFIKTGSIKGSSVPKNDLLELVNTLDIETVVELLSQYKDLDLQILYENQKFTLDESRRKFRNSQYPSDFMVIFNGMVIPIRQVFNYFDLRTGHVDNQSDIFVENRDYNRKILETLLEINDPELKVIHSGTEYSIKEFLDNFGNEQNVRFGLKYGEKLLKPEDVIKFIISRYGNKDLALIPNYETTIRPNQREQNVVSDRDFGNDLFKLISELSENVDSNKVLILHKKQFLTPKEALELFKNEVPTDITFFENRRRIEPQELIAKYNLLSFKPESSIESTHKGTERPEQKYGTSTSSNFIIDYAPDFNKYDFTDLIKELSEKPESDVIQILYKNQIFRIKELLNQFKNKVPFDISFIVNNRIVDPEQLTENYNLITFTPSKIRSIPSNFKIFSNGKMYHPKYFSEIYQNGMDFQIFFNDKPITWENVYKLIRTKNNFENFILIHGVYFNPMTILMKIVQHLTTNSEELFIYHEGRTYTPHEFFEEFDCKIPNGTHFLINNEVVTFKQLIEITGVDNGIAKFLSTITYVGSDLIKMIRNDSNFEILYENQSYTIPSFLAKYASYPKLSVQIKYDNRILNLNEILGIVNLHPTLSEVVEAIPHRRKKLKHNLDKRGDSIEIMHGNNKYPKEAFWKLYPHENNTDFQIIFENQKLSAPDAVFVLDLDITDEIINNEDISFEDPEFKYVIRRLIRDNPSNVTLYYRGIAYTPYTFDLTFGGNIPVGVEVLINNNLVNWKDIPKLLQSMEQPSQPDHIVINNLRFQTPIVLQKILKLLSELNIKNVEVNYNGRKYTPLSFYEEFKTGMPINITFKINDQMITLEKLVQILGVDDMVNKIITSIDDVGKSMMNYLINKSNIIVKNLNERYDIQEFISKFGDLFNEELLANGRKNLGDINTPLGLTIDFNEFIRGIENIETSAVHQLAILNPEGVSVNYNNISYTPKQFEEDFKMDIPKDYNVTLWKNSVTIPDTIFLYNLDLGNEPIAQRKVIVGGDEYQNNLDQFPINEDDTFFIKLLQRHPNNVYVKFKDVLLTPLQLYNINGVPKLDTLEFVIDGKTVPKEDVMRLIDLDEPNNNPEDNSVVNNNAELFDELIRKRPKNVYVEYNGVQLTPEQYLLINGYSNNKTPNFIVNGQPVTQGEVIRLLKFYPTNQYDEYGAYPIIKISKGFYTPSDLVLLLLQYNPGNIMILYNGDVYSPEDFIAAIQGYIPENIEFLESGSIIPPAEIVRKFNILEFAQEDKYWPSIVINGKIYTKEDFIRILASLSSESIRIGFEGTTYAPSQFYEIFKENIPENFDVQLFGLTVNRRLIIELIFDAVMKSIYWKNLIETSQLEYGQVKSFGPTLIYNY